eukprot:GFKZ01006352.1.p1 GENE.GFKZ01006352.1~~GFKZ01006352.1.p1  ORF type:complete len:406 (+),score=39.95 GFKZ01006352.1:539-1756(+)
MLPSTQPPTATTHHPSHTNLHLLFLRATPTPRLWTRSIHLPHRPRPTIASPVPTAPTPIVTPAVHIQHRSHYSMVATPAESPWRVVVTRRVAKAAMDMLRDASPKLELDVWESDEPMPAAELISRLKVGTDALYCVLTDKITAEVLEAAGSRLKVVSTMSVGYNHIDVGECKRRGIIVGNTPDVLTETTADTTVGLVLAACRRFKEATASVVDGTWGTWSPNGMCGPDVHGAVVGIIGLGRIGAAVARRLRAFNCSILYSGRTEKAEVAAPLEAKFVSEEELLKTADIVIPLCPLNAETAGKFGKETFGLMKKTAVFINAARGELVNQEDLVAALNEGEIFAAGLDVTTPEPLPTDSPLIKCPNCFILPHIGSASDGTRTAMATLAARNLLAAYSGVELPSEVKA